MLVISYSIFNMCLCDFCRAIVLNKLVGVWHILFKVILRRDMNHLYCLSLSFKSLLFMYVRWHSITYKRLIKGIHREVSIWKMHIELNS
jgi:hypothetical protein